MCPTWQHQAEESEDRWLWDRALMADPAACYKYQAQEEMNTWQVADGSQAVFSGEVATDGSRIGAWEHIARAGMAVVQLKEDSEEVEVAC